MSCGHLSAVHFLLTYACNLECDHCFLYCGPRAGGTFTLEQIGRVVDELVRIGTIEWVYFEGGEPFLFYPLMLEGLKAARGAGFKTGVVTDAYWATSAEDAELWLEPLCQLGVSDLSVSNDRFHYEGGKDNPAERALTAARRLGMPVDTICIKTPSPAEGKEGCRPKGLPYRDGGALVRGRAAEKLTEGLPLESWRDLNKCPYEDLEDPKRVHVDPYGHVHLCQGLTMGNLWETPLSVLVRDYEPRSHPICRPLIEGGPAALAETYNVDHNDEYVDPCHLCYSLRRVLLDRFPHYLAPRQVYGLE